MDNVCFLTTDEHTSSQIHNISETEERKRMINEISTLHERPDAALRGASTSLLHLNLCIGVLRHVRSYSFQRILAPK